MPPSLRDTFTREEDVEEEEEALDDRARVRARESIGSDRGSSS